MAGKIQKSTSAKTLLQMNDIYTIRPLDASGPQSLTYHLNKLSYAEKRQFFAKHIQPRYPRFQYKFMHIPREGSEIKTKYLEDILLESRFYLCSPLEFNDPFDMSANVVFESSTKDLRERFNRLITSQNAAKSWKERRDLVDKFMARGREAWLDSIKSIFHQRQKQTGVTCFAGDPRSILMWSHYAKNHTGICLQFEVIKDIDTFLEALPVEYVNEHPTYNWAADSNEMYRKILLSKFSAWSYEHESRIIKQGGANTYLRFAPEALVGVILGSRIDKITTSAIYEILKARVNKGHPEIKIYHASKHSSQYKLVLHR